MNAIGNVLKAYHAGNNARAKGFHRLSPFCNDMMTEYFLAGYDHRELDPDTLAIKPVDPLGCVALDAEVIKA